MHKTDKIDRRVPRNWALLLASLLILLMTFLRIDREISPIRRELWSGKLNNFRDDEYSSGKNITIVDFFKPCDGIYPSSAPADKYFKRINLRSSAPYSIPRANFSLWIDQQFSESFENVLSNVGDENLANFPWLGSYNVLEGVVIASPSQNEPNYFFQWIRDSAITMNAIVSNLFPEGEIIANVSRLNLTLAGTVLKYLSNSHELQRLRNPSGDGVGSDGLKGLGEPKWNVNNEPYMDAWGRPQNDGPPLRALTILHFLNTLDKNEISLEEVISSYEAHFEKPLSLPFKNTKELYEKILYWDLKFVVENWKEETFDLWEEVRGQHFFTSIVQLSSLKSGMIFLKGHNDDWPELQGFLEELEHCYDELTTFLLMEGGFLNPNKNYIVETPSVLHSRSGLDIAVIIGSILTHDYYLDSPDAVPFDVDDSGVLNTLYSLVKSMEMIYPINHQRANLRIGVALGRYPEDVYDGIQTSEGNPWFLSTAYASELIYKLILKNYKFGNDLLIPLNTWESEFWTLIFEGFEEYRDENLIYNTLGDTASDFQLVIPYNSPAFNQTMISLFDFAESFLDKIREHVSDDGNMSEQFNKYTGYLQGAENLSWSYGAFWTSCRMRLKVLQIIG